MSNDSIGVILIFLKEIICTRECYLIDIFVNLSSCHTYAAVTYRDAVLAYSYMYRKVTHLALEIAFGGKSLELLGCINSI